MRVFLITGALLVTLTFVAGGRGQDAPIRETPPPPRPPITSPSDRPAPPAPPEEEHTARHAAKPCRSTCTPCRRWRRCFRWRPLRLFRCR
jgi:hypothetical protein